MRSPLTIKPVTPIRKFAPPSRLIPGVQASVDAVRRKKSSSAIVDGRFWESQDHDSVGEPRKRHLNEVLAEALFPRLSVHGQRWNLARQVSADFLLIILGFAAVGHLIVLLEFAIHHDPAALLRPEPFPTAGPGLLLLYGALFTLLGFSERLYHPETVQTPRREQTGPGQSRILVGGAGFHGSGMVRSSPDFAHDLGCQCPPEFPDHAWLEEPLATLAHATGAERARCTERADYRRGKDRP